MITPSTADNNRATPAAPRAKGWARRWRRAQQLNVRYLAHRRMRRALAVLDDRLLQDIGLTREAVSRERSLSSYPWRWAAS